MDPLKTLEYFESRRDEIIGLIRKVVDIESPSHDAARNREVVDWVERQARATGVEVMIERTSVDDGDHIVIRAFESDEKCSMLLGHTDTVHPVGTQQQNPTRIDGDRFFGCGIFDMKSGIVMMLEALRYFAVTQTRPSRPMTIVLSCDEEIGSFTGRELAEREAANAEHCLVFEPSADGKVKTGRKGTGMFTVRTHGIPAHAGLEPEKGANAIVELALQIERINAIARPEIGTTVNVTTIRGGTTTNVIPENAQCSLDVRFSSMAEAERVDAAVRSLEPIDPRVSIELLGDINRPPMERTDAVVELYEKARDIANSFGYELDETQVGGASDGNFIAALGVPILDGLGITGAGAHRLDEHILVSDIVNRAALVSLLLAS